MLETPQLIEVMFNGYKYSFAVWRYNTDVELHAALNNAGIKYDKHTTAATLCTPEKCQLGGQICTLYILDKSIKVLAKHASIMAAMVFYAANGPVQLTYTGQITHGVNELAELTGEIASELYAKQKFF